MAFLADEFPKALPAPASGEAAATLRELQPRIAREIVAGVIPQLRVLANVIGRIADFAARRMQTGGRVVILELPIGNSIPSKLLERALVQIARRAYRRLRFDACPRAGRMPGEQSSAVVR